MLVAVGDVAAEPERRAAAGDTAAGDADAQAILIGDFFGGGLGRFGIQIDADDVRAILHQAMRGFLADAGTGADDDGDLPRQFLLRGHALELRLLQKPVLDIESFLLRQRDVFVDRLRAAHHFHRAVVKLRRNADLTFVLSPSDHAQAGDQDHRRIRIPHRRRIRMLAASRNTPRSPCDTARDLPPASSSSAARSSFSAIPLDIERLDLRAQKMIRAARAELGEARPHPSNSRSAGSCRRPGSCR